MSQIRIKNGIRKGISSYGLHKLILFLRRLISRIMGTPELDKTEEPTGMGENDIFFHEDLYCQVEILPRENSVNLDLENRRISGFSEENAEAHGFSDLYVRGKQNIETLERKIAVAELEELLLGLGFTKKDAVYSGYGSSIGKCRNTNAYGLGAAVVYCDFQDAGWVENIWVDGFRGHSDSARRAVLLRALKAIGFTWNMILNDWDLAEKVDLAVEGEIERYLGAQNSSDPLE